MGLRRRLLDVVLGDLPAPTSRLEEPNPRWDVLLGGRRRPGVWGRFATGYGTSCAIVLDGWAIDAGFPADMVVQGDTPNGGGTKVLQAVQAGAKSRDWWRTPARGVLPDLRPGDVYGTNHATKDGSDGTHVGVIVSVTPSADGQSLEVETADGGQGTRDHQYAGRRTRTVRLSGGAHPVVVTSPGLDEAWLDWWVRVGGDEADEVPVIATASGDGAAAALGLVGAAMLAGGLYWYFKGRPTLFAVQEATVNLRPAGDRRDFDLRRKYEHLLADHGYEVTGAGTALGGGGVLGADVDVRCAGACDQARLRELAQRVGLAVDDVVLWGSR